MEVRGDLVTLDFDVPNDDWALGGTAMLKAFVQHIVYTASEEPGIRRVLITQHGGRTAIIGGEGLEVREPATREQVAGYAVPSMPGEVRSDGEIAQALGVFGFSVEREALGLVRASLELRSTNGLARWIPTFTATVAPVDEDAYPERGEWLLSLDVPGVRDAPKEGFIVGTQHRPLRWLATESTALGTRYLAGLDELRPWRAAVLADPVRVVVDFGGDPDALAANTAVYAPSWGASVTRVISVTGLARAFEANVLWRVKDSLGKVLAAGHTTATLGTSAAWGGYAITAVLPEGTSGQVELEVYQSSPKDGSEIELVRVPVFVR